MRIQSTHTSDERGLDAYFTCPEAIETLILLEGDRIPQRIWEPAAGDGAIVLPLRATGRTVLASDIPITVCRGAGSWITSPPRPCRPAGSMALLQIHPTVSPALRRKGAQRGALCRTPGAHELPDGRRAPRAVARSESADPHLVPPAAPADDAQARLGGCQVDEQHTPLLGGLGGRRDPYAAPACLLARSNQRPKCSRKSA